jgi:thiol-disulfide isomerase/thioredoxin
MRKKIFLFLLVLAGIGNAIAQNASVINGTWNKKTPRTIKLFKVQDGVLKEIASTSLTDDNKFLFALSPQKEGFYTIGLNPSGQQNNYTFYFKPGDNLNVLIEEGNKYTLVGENTPENKEMARWHDFILPVENKAVYFQGQNSTYVDFFPLLKEKLEGLNTYRQNYMDNPVFNEAFKYFRKFDMEFYAFHYLCTPRSAHPKAVDLPDYYRKTDISDITSTDKLMDYPYGMDLITRYYMVQASYMPENIKKLQGENKSFSQVLTLPQIVNDRIKGEIVLEQANYIKSYDGFLDFENKYGKYLVTPSQKERFKNLITKVADNSVGQTAIDFKFADKTGKETALSDLKGKVVYIDIWATWCGPCRKEFPHLKKLEAEYHGNNNIVFMGVNVDVTKDKQKWLDFLDKEQLPGLQVFAGDAANEALMKPYKVSGIPRFILVGKDGKLIFADAPRPSSDELRSVLNAALKK